jgi:hypothetical protein
VTGGVKRRFGSRRKSSGTSIIQLPAMGYGALRNPVAKMIMPMTHQFTGMLGDYEDEAVMLATSWALARFGSGMIAEAGRAGLVVENASIGATLTKGISLGGTTATNNFEY